MRENRSYSIAVWEEGYGFRIRVAILIAILAHTAALYCWVKPQQYNDFHWDTISQPKNIPTVYTFPLTEPTPKPKRTPKRPRSTGRTVTTVKPPPRLNPIPQHQNVNIDLDDQLSIDINPDDFELDEPEPPVDTPYDINHPAVVRPVCLQKIAPVFPRIVNQLRLSGVTILRCVIRKDGIPSEIEVIQSFNSACDTAALEAVRQWRFSPATLNDVPVPVIMEISVAFRPKH